MCSNNVYISFYENIISCGFATKITLPTRICDTRVLSLTMCIQMCHISGILIRPISDHQMYFCVMNENIRKPVTQSNHIEVEILNEESISNFQNKIAKLEIHNKLDENPNKNPNYNYKILSTLLQNAKSKHIPKQMSGFNKRRHKKQKWMTDELLAKIVIKMKCMLIGKQLQ